MKKVSKSHLDQAMEATLQREKKVLSEPEIAGLAARLYTQILCKTTTRGLSLLSKYYSSVKRMSREQLFDEKHKPSRLSRHLKYTGNKRHPNTAAHAIVSGTHPEAMAAERILARWKIRIDDPDNGVFFAS